MWIYLTFEILYLKLSNLVSKDIEVFFDIYSMQVKVLVLQSCPTLCDPMDCSLPVSSVHGIFEARILECVAISLQRKCIIS